MKNNINILVLLLAALFCSMSIFAENVNEDKKTDMKMLRTFYTKYITNMLENRDRENSELMEQYFLPELIVGLDEMNDYSDVNNVLRAQDVSEKMTSTLEITPLATEWYMVSYVWDGKKVEIPVKTTQRDGRRMIEYIVPEGMGKEYGNDLLPDVVMLTDFYKEYIKNGLDGNVKGNRNLINRYLTCELCTRYRKMMVNFGDDILLKNEPYSMEILNTLNVKKTGYYTYKVWFKSSKEVTVTLRMAFMGCKWFISGIE